MYRAEELRLTVPCVALLYVWIKNQLYRSADRSETCCQKFQGNMQTCELPQTHQPFNYSAYNFPTYLFSFTSVTKKIISIFFILLMFLNSAGLLFYYYSEVEARKIEMREYVASSKNFDTHLLVVFSSEDKNIESIDRNEISYGGKMFDIVKTEKKDGYTLYYVISDNREDELLISISELTKQNRNAAGQPQEKKMAYEVLKFVHNNNNLSTNLYAVNMHADWFSRSPDYYSSPSKNIITPPPRHIFS